MESSVSKPSNGKLAAFVFSALSKYQTRWHWLWDTTTKSPFPAGTNVLTLHNAYRCYSILQTLITDFHLQESLAQRPPSS